MLTLLTCRGVLVVVVSDFMSGQFLWLLVAVLGILVEGSVHSGALPLLCSSLTLPTGVCAAFVLRQVWAVIYSIKLLSAAGTLTTCITPSQRSHVVSHVTHTHAVQI